MQLLFLGSFSQIGPLRYLGMFPLVVVDYLVWSASNSLGTLACVLLNCCFPTCRFHTNHVCTKRGYNIQFYVYMRHLLMLRGVL
jgi:hypothetical protein